MKEVSASWRSLGKWSPALFFAAGGLLGVQVLMIGFLRYNIASFSDLWIAPPAIAALVAGIIGLIGLYPRTAGQAPRLACAGAASAIAAGIILCVAATWLIGSALLGGITQPPPAGFLALIAAFMLAFILAFILSSAASLRADGSLRTVGYLLLVPVISWGMILVVGIVTSMSEALLLDFYTNGLISLAFLAIGHILKPRRERFSQ
jgi:hypothetical protein